MKLFFHLVYLHILYGKAKKAKKKKKHDRKRKKIEIEIESKRLPGKRSSYL